MLSNKNEFKCSIKMKKHYLIDLKKEEPGIERKTKFGGQPDWIDKPEWPLSMEFGDPMQFICQIELEAIGFSDFEAKFAYLFVFEGSYNAGRPDGGENAVILQPGDNSRFDIEQMLTGPSISRDYKGWDVDLKLSIEKQDEMGIITTKFGGEPLFLHHAEYPYTSTERKEVIDGEEVIIAEKWHLLIQLGDRFLPYFRNYGMGVGYAFIRDDGKVAKYMWQGSKSLL